MELKRIYHQAVARLASRWPALSDNLVASFSPATSTSVPWQPVAKPLAQMKIALVTTAGLHHKNQQPFDMLDPQGDPSFRIIVGRTIADDFTITHDYYDHRDAGRDPNVVFPITRLQEMQAAGCIGALAERHFGFMGHVLGSQVERLTNEFAPQVAAMARQDQVDVVLLTPA